MNEHQELPGQQSRVDPGLSKADAEAKGASRLGSPASDSGAFIVLLGKTCRYSPRKQPGGVDPVKVRDQAGHGSRPAVVTTNYLMQDSGLPLSRPATHGGSFLPRSPTSLSRGVATPLPGAEGRMWQWPSTNLQRPTQSSHQKHILQGVMHERISQLREVEKRSRRVKSGQGTHQLNEAKQDDLDDYRSPLLTLCPN